MKKIALLVYVMVVFLSSSFSQDRIYWGNQTQDNIGSVTASNLGSATMPVASAQNPSGLAYYHANPTYPLFFASASVIYRNDLAGNSNLIITPTGQFNRGVTIDYIGKKIYWANSQNGYIARANLDGSSKDEAFLTGLTNPWDIEIDPVNQKIYWTEDVAAGTIKRANLSDGSNVEPVITNIQSLGVAVDPLRGKIYYTEFGSGPKVYAANLNGSGAAAITGLSALADIDVDFSTGTLYMVDYGTKLLTKADPDGTNKTSVTADGLFITYADVTIPVISTIARQNPPTIDVGEGESATFRVTFSEPVLNLNAADFELTGTPTGTISVSHVSLNKVFDIVVSNISGTGTLDLNVAATHDIIDFGGNAFGGTINSEHTFNVIVIPTPVVTSLDPTSGPVGTSVVITGTNFSSAPSENIVTFNGVTATVTASTSTSITTTVPAGATTGVVAVTVIGKTGNSPNNFTVTCTPPPKPTVTLTGNVLTSSADAGNQWFKNDIEISGAINKSFAAMEPGSYTVRVTVNACASASDPAVVTETNLTPVISDFTPASGPIGTTVVITGTGFSTTPAANAVAFNGVTATVTGSTSTSITTAVPANALPGSASLTVTVNGRTGAGATNFTVTCVGPPKPTIATDGALLTSSSDTNNQWFKNGTAIAGAISKTFSAIEPGAYSVKVTVNGCSAESDPTTITGSEEIVALDVNIFPNPVHAFVKVELPVNTVGAAVEISSITGVKKDGIWLPANGGRSVAEFDVRHYAAGLYVVTISSGNGRVTKKFQKR